MTTPSSSDNTFRDRVRHLPNSCLHWLIYRPVEAFAKLIQRRRHERQMRIPPDHLTAIRLPRVDLPKDGGPVPSQRGGSMPRLDVVVTERFLEHSFVYPNPWMHADGQAPGSTEVICHVGFGVSPLNDRVYVDGLHVDEEHRRQGRLRFARRSCSARWPRPSVDDNGAARDVPFTRFLGRAQSWSRRKFICHT